MARFHRDALSQPAVKAVILLEGINDIGFSAEPDTGCFSPNDPKLTATQIEAGYRRLIKMAHASGVKIIAGTLMPFLGSNCLYAGNYGTRRGETLRERVNHWIRTSHAFDGVADLARATADPYNHRYLPPTTAPERPPAKPQTACTPTTSETKQSPTQYPLKWFTK